MKALVVALTTNMLNVRVVMLSKRCIIEGENFWLQQKVTELNPYVQRMNSSHSKAVYLTPRHLTGVDSWRSDILPFSNTDTPSF